MFLLRWAQVAKPNRHDRRRHVYAVVFLHACDEQIPVQTCYLPMCAMKTCARIGAVNVDAESAESTDAAVRVDPDRDAVGLDRGLGVGANGLHGDFPNTFSDGEEAAATMASDQQGMFSHMACYQPTVGFPVKQSICDLPMSCRTGILNSAAVYSPQLAAYLREVDCDIETLEVDAASAVHMIRYAIGTAAVQDSVTAMPPGAVVVETDVDIVVAFSPGTGLVVGSTLDPNLYQELADNTPTVSAFYPLPQNTNADPGVVRTTLTGAPVVGSGFVTILYAVPSP